MQTLKTDLTNLDDIFPSDFTEEQVNRAKTFLLKKIALLSHRMNQGKMQTTFKVPVPGFNWYNVWYTPGVSAISTAIRDNIHESYNLSNRSNLVGVVSDSTRVLGDGDCGVAGGLGVMEGKAFLMKYLAGVDGHALCINSRNEAMEPQAQKIIDFVKMVEPSYGAINLEDISQPNCYEVLDRLREECEIPVWHDDAQGTACVILAGLINALKLAEKDLAQSKIVLLGAGAANTTVAKLLLLSGANPSAISLFDKDGGLHIKRKDLESDKRMYKQWDLCQLTNPACYNTPAEAISHADVLIALSQPGPDIIKPHWIQSMAEKPILFACANPVPEIYPSVAKQAGAFIIATGRGDFPNQANNSLCFPGILKGALLTHARKITDTMAIRAAKAIAMFAQNKGITPDQILPTMDDMEVFPYVAAETAMQAIEDRVARIFPTHQEVYETTLTDIQQTRTMMNLLVEHNLIPTLSESDIQNCLQEVIHCIREQ